jgi:hypothetical protein
MRDEHPGGRRCTTDHMKDPVIAEGFAQGELRPFRISLLRGRD